MYLIDTNIMMDYPYIVLKKKCAIHQVIIDELDGLKNSENLNKAKKARKASKVIYQNFDKLTFLKKRPLIYKKIDDLLIWLAKKEKLILLTNDINMTIKAKQEKVKTEFYFEVKNDYIGINYYNIENNEEEISLIYENKINNFRINQYCIINSKNDKNIQDILKYNGNNFEKVLYKTIQIENKIIKPKNPEQQCLIDSLYNSNIILVEGTYGVGKSMITTAFALQEFEKGNIEKIIYVPNNSIVANTREIGILPGTLLEKQLAYLGTLIDLIGLDNVIKMCEENTLEIVPISLMRGRNFENSIILVNEAQNLTNEHIKLLIARCANNTKIIFDGDIKQIDQAVFKDKNGLNILKELSNSPFSDIFSMVTLNKIERSRTAQAANFLDNF